MEDSKDDLSSELKQLRALETEIISLYFNTVSNYSKLNKNLAKKGGLDNSNITTNYSNIIDLQLQIFENLVKQFDDVNGIEEYKSKTEKLLNSLQEIEE